MSIGGKKTWLALGLLAVLGSAGYEGGWYAWGRYQYRAAQEAIDQRNFELAETHLRKILSAWPDDQSFRLLAAQTARRRGNFEEAATQLRLCKHNSKQFKELLALEHKLLRVQQGDLSEADWLLSFCTEYPEAPETPLVLEAFLEGSLRVLKKLAQRTTASEPGEAVDGSPLGRAMQAVGMWLERRQDKADQVQGLFWRARLRLFVGEHDEVIDDCRRALELDPSHFEARFLMATVLAQTKPAEAVAHLEMLRQRNPESFRVRYALANVQRQLGRLQDARQLLDELLTLDAEDARVLVELGKVALAKHDFAESERWLRKALANAPDEPPVHLTLSQCLEAVGKSAEAKRHQERFAQLHAEMQRQREAALHRIKGDQGK